MYIHYNIVTILDKYTSTLSGCFKLFKRLDVIFSVKTYSMTIIISAVTQRRSIVGNMTFWKE